MMIPTDELEDYPKRTSLRRALPYVVAVCVLGLIAYGIARPARTGSRQGEPAPSFDLAFLDGNGSMSSEDLAGHPVVVNFWASWCGPCREEAPLLERKWRAYRDRGVMFVGVVVKDTPASALDFVDRFDLTYPMLFDPDQVLARQLGLVGLPQTFFIDASGRLMGSSSTDAQATSGNTTVLGAIEADDLDRRIEDMLERGP